MLEIVTGAPQRHRCLTVFPLFSSTSVELPYALLADALAAGQIRIMEVGQGSVPELLAANRGDQDVLILDGEQLIGARQNRMTNRSIILPAHTETKIPVSCMEQGRWSFRTDHMAPAPQHSPANVRRHARRSEAAYARRQESAGAAGAGAGMAAGAASDPAHATRAAFSGSQGPVWKEIAGYALGLKAQSATGAMDEIYTRRKDDLAEWLAAFPRLEGQVGLLAFVGESPLGLDVIGGRSHYARFHERLLHGYVVDAMAAEAGARRGAAASAAGDVAHPDPAAAAAFLDRVRDARRVDTPTVGRGTYRVLDRRVVGGELEDEGRLVHRSAFPADDGDIGDGPGSRPGTVASDAAPIPSPSSRRRFWPRR